MKDKLIFDTSIMKWRKRTAADIAYAESVMQAVIAERSKA